MQRRNLLSALLAAGTAAGVGVAMTRLARAGSDDFAVTHSDAEWRNMLSDLEYRVMRRNGTEPAGSSPLDKLYDDGTYHCRGCDQALYSSRHKFDSGTGWPSFYQALPDAVGTKADYKLILPRTECHCSRCGCHLGHVFDDGPPPTGLRHCINGVALVFRAA